ncbi:hypothetical protein Tco_1301879 [Tanacetum coccineum]
MGQTLVPPSPDYIPGPEDASPTPTGLYSPGYVPESDPEEEPEEDDEDPEEDPADYPADRDDDDEEEEPFGDDADDEDEDEDEEEEEEHPAPADSVPPVHRMTARISIQDEPSISLPPREEVERLLALTTPPPSPLTPLSSPLPHIPSPPFQHHHQHLYYLHHLCSYYLLTTGQTGPRLHYHLGRGWVLTLVLGTRLERVQLQLPLDRLEVVGQTMGLSVLWIPRSDDREPRRSAMGLEMFG